MEKLCAKHKKLDDKFHIFQARIEAAEKKFPLDYILKLPEELLDNKVGGEMQERIGRLMEIQKNVVFKIII